MLALRLGRRCTSHHGACSAVHGACASVALRSSSPSSSARSTTAAAAAASFSTSAADLSKKNTYDIRSQLSMVNKHKKSVARKAALRRALQFSQGVTGDTVKHELAATSQQDPELLVKQPHLGESSVVQDIAAIKPERPPQLGSDRYPKIHQRLTNKLDQFLKGQLAEYCLVHAVQLSPRRTGTRETAKATVIQSILDAWGCFVPVPKVEEFKSSKAHPLTAIDLFLLQDQVEASSQFKHMRPQFTTGLLDLEGNGDPYMVTVEGTDANHAEYAEWLQKNVKAQVVERWNKDEVLGWEAPALTMWHISTMTKTYLEIKDGEYVATALNGDNIQRARDMILTAARAGSAALPPLNVSTSGEYVSLTPHLPAPSSPLPWKTSAQLGRRSFFRMTRIYPATEMAHTREARQRATNMARIQVNAYATGTGETVELAQLAKDTLASLQTDGVAGDRTLAFTLGHLLTPSPESRHVKLGLIPPVKGSDLPESTRWNGLLPFVLCPTIPSALIAEPLPPQSQRTRRIIYVPTGDVAQEGAAALSIEYTYPPPPPPVVEEIGTGSESASWIDRLGAMISVGNVQQVDGEAAAVPESKDVEITKDGLDSLLESDTAAPQEKDAHPYAITPTLRREVAVDLLLPERSIDARVNARTAQAVSISDVPVAVHEFFGEVHKHSHLSKDIPITNLAALRTTPQLPVADEATTDGDFTFPSDQEWWAGENEEPRPMAKSHFPPLPKASEPAPAPTSPQVSLVPPRTITFRGQPYVLDADEVRDTIERVVTEFETTPEALAAVGNWSAATPVGMLRTVEVTDLTGLGGVVRFAELEAAELDDTGAPNEGVWRELAQITSETVPVRKSIGSE